MFIGYSRIIIVRIKNKTDHKIEKINISYDGCKYRPLVIKNIKPNDIKQTGISTVNLRTRPDLKIFINEEKKFVIKECIKENDFYSLDVVITKIYEDGTIEYESNIES